MVLSRHGHIFYCEFGFSEYIKAPAGFKDFVEYDNWREQVLKKKENLFVIETKSLVYLHGKCSWNIHPKKREAGHYTITERGLH